MTTESEHPANHHNIVTGEGVFDHVFGAPTPAYDAACSCGWRVRFSVEKHRDDAVVRHAMSTIPDPVSQENEVEPEMPHVWDAEMLDVDVEELPRTDGFFASDTPEELDQTRSYLLDLLRQSPAVFLVAMTPEGKVVHAGLQDGDRCKEITGGPALPMVLQAAMDKAADMYGELLGRVLRAGGFPARVRFAKDDLDEE